MNKQKFEAYLRSELSILQNDEIDEIVSEYLQHIDMKVLEGVSEEEAIADFGNLNSLVNDLLSAYKIDSRDRTFRDFETKSKSILNTILNFINSIVSQLMKMSASQIIGLIIEFAIVLLLLTIFNSIVSGLLGSIGRAFYFRPYFISSIIRLLISIVDIIVTLSISVIVLYWFAQERILSKFDLAPHKKTDKDYFDSWKPEAFTQPQEKKENFKASYDYKQTNQASKSYESVTDKIINESPKMKKSIDRSLFTVVSFIFKAILLMILIPSIVANVLFGIVYLYLLYATVSGFGSIGLVLIGAGVFLFLFSFNIFLIKLVGGKKDEEVHNNI